MLNVSDEEILILAIEAYLDAEVDRYRGEVICLSDQEIIDFVKKVYVKVRDANFKCGLSGIGMANNC